MRARLPLVLALASFVYGTANSGNDITTNYQNVCHVISTSISSKSAVHYPGKFCVHIQNLMSGHEAVFIGSTLYALDVYHYANSSTQQSACTVEPGTANDVGKIVSG